MESKIIVRESITTEELAQRLITIVKNGQKVSLATDCSWYKTGLVNPESAYFPAGAVCFEGVDFHLLGELLCSKGVHISVYPGQSSVYMVDSKPYTTIQDFLRI